MFLLRVDARIACWYRLVDDPQDVAMVGFAEYGGNQLSPRLICAWSVLLVSKAASAAVALARKRVRV